MPRLLIVILTLVVFLSACTDEGSQENEESNNEQTEETEKDQTTNADTPDMLNRSQALDITETLLTDIHNAMKSYKQDNDLNELMNQESMEDVAGKLDAELEEFTTDDGLAQVKDHMMKTYFQPARNSGLHPDQIDTRFQILDVNQSDGKSNLIISYLTLPDETYTAAGTYEVELIQDQDWKIANINYINANEQPLNLEQRDITDLGYQFIDTFENNDQTYIAYQQDGMLIARDTETGAYGMNDQKTSEENADSQDSEDEEQSSEDSTEEDDSSDKSERTSSEQEESSEEANQSEQNSSLKQKYREKLNNTQQRVDSLEVASGATADLVDYENERFEKWDTLLNNIYGALESNLSTSEMEDLRQKQREWLTYRDDSAEQAAAEYGSGSFAKVAYPGTLADLTKERCYELVNQYME